MKLLTDYIEIIENSLKEYNPVTENLQKTIYEASAYSLEAGGKRLRPVLLMETNRIFGGNIKEAMPFACAMEMIHTYSLIHDDLPAMDNDDLRRGKPTNHIVYGEATAILAGDALLTKAFEIMAKADCENKTNQLKAISYIASASGSDGMIGGQIVDLESENKQISIDTLRYMHRHKTGALIKAACVAGGILAGVDEATLECISEYAEHLGIAFQIRDDILDVTGDEEALGKPVGSDADSCKSTYVSLLGIDESEKLCLEHTNKALECLAQFNGDVAELSEFTKKLANRNL